MRKIIILVVGVCLAISITKANDSFVVHLIDPRIVTHTDNVIGIEWGEQSTDIIESVVLSSGQKNKLRNFTLHDKKRAYKC